MKRVEYRLLTRSEVLPPSLGLSVTARVGDSLAPFWCNGGGAAAWLESCLGALIGGRRDDFFWRNENPFPLSSIFCDLFRFSDQVSFLRVGRRIEVTLPPRPICGWSKSWAFGSANAEKLPVFSSKLFKAWLQNLYRAFTSACSTTQSAPTNFDYFLQ